MDRVTGREDRDTLVKPLNGKKKKDHQNNLKRFKTTKMFGLKVTVKVDENEKKLHKIVQKKKCFRKTQVTSLGSPFSRFSSFIKNFIRLRRLVSFIGRSKTVYQKQNFFHLNTFYITNNYCIKIIFEYDIIKISDEKTNSRI